MADNPSRRESTRDSILGPNTFLRGPEVLTSPDTSHRRSRASMHSWMSPQLSPGLGPSAGDQPPISSPPPAVRSPRSPPTRLLITNPDEDADLSEYMNIDPDVSGRAMGYKNGYAVEPSKERGSNSKRQGYFGTIVKGLKKLPGSVFGRNGPAGGSGGRRYQRRGTLEGIEPDLTGNTLPRYVSNPNTPVVSQLPANQRLGRRPLPLPLPNGPHPDVIDGLPPSLVPGAMVRRRPPNPSFQVTPPLSDSPSSNSGTYVPPVQFPQPVIPHDLMSTVSTPPANQTADAAPALAPSRSYSHHSRSENHATSPHPTRIDIDETQATIELSARSPPRRTTAGTIPTLAQNIEDAPQAQDPSSVAVQPLPTEDYRRMSRSIAHQTIGSDSIMSYDPSFSTELSPTHGFFHTLWHMPWVASDRITVDYFPGMSRGAWDWRRVALGNRDSTGTTRTHKDRTGVEYKPVQKPLKSWYTGVPPVGKATDWAKRGEKTEPAVDLLSSGTSASGTRSSMATSNMPGSPGPRGGRRRSSRRDSRRLFYSPNQYTYIDVSHNATPPLRVKKKPRQNSTKYSREREKHTTRSHSRRQRERTHHRAHASSQPAPPPPVPPLPTFSNGYAPYAPAPASPFYFFQPPPLTPSNTNVDPNQAHAQTPGLLSPVLMQMQMVPAMFAPASVGTASPPGVAGRGAGGGYGPPGATGNFPGGFGMSPVSESTPKQNQQTL